jgi:hypothetical protein
MHARCWSPLHITEYVGGVFPTYLPEGRKQVIWCSYGVWMHSFPIPSLVPHFKHSKCAINVGELLRKSNVWGLQSLEYTYPLEERTPKFVNEH